MESVWGECNGISRERGKYPTSYLFHRPYSTRLLLLATMWFLWYIGNYGFLGNAATLLSNQSITIANSILFLAVGAVGYPQTPGSRVATKDHGREPLTNQRG